MSAHEIIVDQEDSDSAAKAMELLSEEGGEAALFLVFENTSDSEAAFDSAKTLIDGEAYPQPIAIIWFKTLDALTDEQIGRFRNNDSDTVACSLSCERLVIEFLARNAALSPTMVDQVIIAALG